MIAIGRMWCRSDEPCALRASAKDIGARFAPQTGVHTPGGTGTVVHPLAACLAEGQAPFVAGMKDSLNSISHTAMFAVRTMSSGAPAGHLVGLK